MAVTAWKRELMSTYKQGKKPKPKPKKKPNSVIKDKGKKIRKEVLTIQHSQNTQYVRRE